MRAHKDRRERPFGNRLIVNGGRPKSGLAPDPKIAVTKNPVFLLVYIIVV